MCAIMLLSQKTSREILQDFLSARQKHIRSLFEGSDKTDSLLESVKSFKSTLFHIVSIFRRTSDSSSSLMDITLESIRSGNFTNLLGLESKVDKPIIVRLFSSSSTNITLLQHYLPDSVRRFVPTMPDVAVISAETLNDTISKLVEDISSDIRNTCGRVLQKVENASDLCTIRSSIWQELLDDERDSWTFDQVKSSTKWTEV